MCTGALVLAAAGLLKGLTATTHWHRAELLNELGASYVPQRVVEHPPNRILTAAGVSPRSVDARVHQPARVVLLPSGVEPRGICAEIPRGRGVRLDVVDLAANGIRPVASCAFASHLCAASTMFCDSVAAYH